MKRLGIEIQGAISLVKQVCFSRKEGIMSKVHFI